jgi:hypothetical protein
MAPGIGEIFDRLQGQKGQRAPRRCLLACIEQMGKIEHNPVSFSQRTNTIYSMFLQFRPVRARRSCYC